MLSTLFNGLDVPPYLPVKRNFLLMLDSAIESVSLV